MPQKNTVEHHIRAFQEEACFIFKNREGSEEVILNSFDASRNFRVDGGKERVKQQNREMESANCRFVLTQTGVIVRNQAETI